jgi:16S rRNA (guanine(966)-N(2))-methyltransferase RsmD
VPGDQTRPITDRVKEALFDILGADVLDSSWWDMFAGTGAVGIEALSRGAASARLTDSNRAPLETIKVNLALTGLSARAEIRRADAFDLLASRPDRRFDYIYVAPPQYKQFWLRSLQALDANIEWLTNDGWAVAQLDPKEYEPLALANLTEFDARRYGTTLLVFFERQGS